MKQKTRKIVLGTLLASALLGLGCTSESEKPIRKGTEYTFRTYNGDGRYIGGHKRDFTISEDKFQYTSSSEDLPWYMLGLDGKNKDEIYSYMAKVPDIGKERLFRFEQK